MKRILYLSFFLSALWGNAVAQAQLPGACVGTTTPTLGICVPPLGQNPWRAEWQQFADKTDEHAALTANAHGATSSNIASRVVARNSTGGIAVSFIDGDLSGTATFATSLTLNPAPCTATQFVTDIAANGDLTCSPLLDANIPDTITATNYLALTAGNATPLTDVLFLDNLGIRGQASDTNPVCSAGLYYIYSDLSEQKWKKCENGASSDIGAGVGGSGTITRVWSVVSGDVLALTAAAGHTFDAGAATSSSPATRSTTLPGACAEGRMMQVTNSGGSETYICTATGVATKLAATTDTAPLATALVTNGTNCTLGLLAGGVSASGVAEDCTDVALQTELDTHTANTTTAHGATTANTANTIVKRDAVGATLWQSPLLTVATLPTCTVAMGVTRVSVSDGNTSTDCISGGGSTLAHCVCDGSPDGWKSDSSGSGGVSTGTIQTIYQNSGSTPTLVSGPNGLKETGFNSLLKSKQLCNEDDVQCEYRWVDQSGRVLTTTKLPGTIITKLWSGESWQLLNSTGGILLETTNAGVMRGTALLQTSCNTHFGLAAGDINLPITSFQQPVTVKSVWCFYNTTTPTTIATFRFEHGNGTALTHSALTCSAPGSNATPQTVTANGSFAAYELLRYDVTNTPSPSNDYYTQCVSYVLD